MSVPCITVSDISKRYQLGRFGRAWDSGLRHALTDLIRRPFQRRDNTETEFWALKNISFDVQEGEVLGIIGRNGAGKSTLLKILSRITWPTEGEARIRGRVASLLEVGTGFHPELTGRENIYLNGAILGMTRAEVRRKFDEIVAFSEVEKFLDTPVKHYSSGMYLRLAFAVAAHLEPEILLIDEVLAVGDAAFQKKCLGKMDDVAKSGRTVLFVSHNLTALQSLCQRVIWLDNGKIMQSGPARATIEQYLAYSIASSSKGYTASITSPDGLQIVSAEAVATGTPNKHYIAIDMPFQLVFLLNFPEKASYALAVYLYNMEGDCILANVSESTDLPKGLVRMACNFPAHLLNDGYFTVGIRVLKEQKTIFQQDRLFSIQVHDIPRTIGWMGKWPGVIRPRLQWQIETIEKTSVLPK